MTLVSRARTLALATAAAALALSLAAPLAAQLQLPLPSPNATVSQTIGLTDVAITYSRPGVKGRTIWGTLVPYDKPWRTGANASTTITFADPVTVEGKKLAAGAYSLYTVPGKGEWTVVFNSDAKAGAGSWDAKKDALRVTVKPAESPDFHEWMTFGFESLTPRSADVVLSWEKLRLAFKVETDTDAKALANARAAVAAAKADDWQTPLRAANYMIENKTNQTDAEAWLKKSLAVKETYGNLAAQARWYAAQGKKTEAVASAEKALKVAAATPEDQRPSDDTTAALKKQMAEWGGKS